MLDYLLSMTIARFRDLCLDAEDPGRLGVFWAAVLGHSWQAQENGDGLLTGPTPQHTIWVNQVPEAKTVKHRVHLDIYTRDLADLEALGATVVEPRPHWAVMADTEGGKFCAFLRPEVPAERLCGLGRVRRSGTGSRSHIRMRKQRPRLAGRSQSSMMLVRFRGSARSYCPAVLADELGGTS